VNESYAASFFSTGATLTVVIVAVALALPATFFLLWLYRRSVAAAMRAASGRPRAAPAAPPAVAPGPRPPLALRVVDAASARTLTPEATELERRIDRNLRANLAVYAVAGLAYAVYQAVVALRADGLELLPIRTVVITWAHLWPLAIAANIVLVPGLRAQALAIVGYFAIPVVLAPSTPLNGPVYWALAMGAPTVMLAAFMHPKLRAAGPLVLAFVLVATAGAQLAGAAAATGVGMRFIVDTAILFEMDALDLLWQWGLAAFVVFAALGWLVLKWIRRRYEAKRVSDRTLTLDALWLIFTFWAALNLANASGRWALVGLGGFLVYKLVAVAGFAVLRARRGGEPGRRLLLLRVFGSRDRSERLVARAGERWRHAGSIQLIAGVDLVTAYLEPHEMLDFVRGALRERYIGDEAQLERQLAGIDLAPDADGRFRVNEFFCRDDTWKATLGRLAQTSDVVLMDLRGFGPANQGCIFELHELVAAVPLDRIALLVDATSDLGLLREVLEAAWAGVRIGSPNAHRAEPSIALLRVEEDDAAAARAIVRALAQAASATPAAQLSSNALATSS
jgi:hypothetical protein